MSRSTTTRRNHRRRQPPRCCASCGATNVKLFQDHIVNLAAGGLDVPANMQWLCEPCHKPKTERERLAGLRAFHAQRYRAPEQHPGRLDNGGGSG